MIYPLFFVGIDQSKTGLNVWVVLLLATLWLPNKIKTPHNQTIMGCSLYSKRGADSGRNQTNHCKL